MAYPDARQLCLRLYGTVDGVPSDLQPQCSRSGLSDTFAQLAHAGWIRNCESQATESAHWIDEIDSILKRGAGVLDFERGEAVARQAGFVQESLR
jgi:hypothetical protein